MLACPLKTWDSAKIRSAVDERGGYPVSDKACAMLNEHGMYLNVSAQATVLSGQNVGSAVMAVWKDGVVSNEKGLSTSVNSPRYTQVA